MSFWRRREVEPPRGYTHMTGWKITSNLADGRVLNLAGSVHVDLGDDPLETVAFVEAMAGGLRGAGFAADVEFETTNVIKR